jgi:molybdopterin-guanine dinucleotide biosynthesis protein A
LYKFTARPVYPDIYIGSGALGGLAAALHYSITPFLAVVACDMPFVSSPLLKRELELLEGGGYDVIIPCSEDGEQPFHAVYRRDTCLGVVKDALASGMLRMNSWYSRVNAHWMEWESVHKIDSHGYAFLNLNTPDDFFAAENIVKMGGG